MISCFLRIWRKWRKTSSMPIRLCSSSVVTDSPRPSIAARSVCQDRPAHLTRAGNPRTPAKSGNRRSINLIYPVLDSDGGQQVAEVSDIASDNNVTACQSHRGDDHIGVSFPCAVIL